MFALIKRDLTQILKRRNNVIPVPPDQLAAGKPYWVPIVNVTDDQSTTDITENLSIVEVIKADKVERVTTIIDRDPALVKQEKEESVEQAVQAGVVEKVLAKAMFQLANEVRLLKGQPKITMPQFKTYLKGLL